MPVEDPRTRILRKRGFCIGGAAWAAGDLVPDQYWPVTVDDDLRLRVSLPPGASGLTDAELRAEPLEVVIVSGGSEGGGLTDAELRADPIDVAGVVAVANFPSFSVSFAVSNHPSSYPVTGTFWQATQPVSGPITDTQIRATPLPVSGTIAISNFPGSQPVSGPITDTQIRATPLPVSGTVAISNFPGSQPVSGTVAVSNFPSFPSSQAVIGTFWQATQPVSGTFWQATQPVSGPLTDAQLRALAVAVSGTFWQTTQPVSGPLTDTQIRATPLPVSGTIAISNFPGSQPVTGTFWQATQPVSGTFWQATQPVSGPVTDAQIRATPLPVSGTVTANLGTVGALPVPATLCVTGTAAAGSAVTVTLPQVAAQFHYISQIRIEVYNVAARTGGATPVVVTTTNVPGSLAYTFQSAGAVGTIESKTDQPAVPLRSSAVNVATTIVCPATTNVIWRVTVFYYAAT